MKGSKRDPMLSVALRSLAQGNDLKAAAEISGIPLEELKSQLDDLAGFVGGDPGHDSGTTVFYVDGASRGNPGPAGAGVVQVEDGEVVSQKTEFLGKATNNVAEYRAVYLALSEALRLGLKDVEIRLDSELVYSQLIGRYKIKDKKLIDAYLEIGKLRDKIDRLNFQRIPRSENLADRVANLAIDSADDRVSDNRKGGK